MIWQLSNETPLLLIALNLRERERERDEIDGER